MTSAIAHVLDLVISVLFFLPFYMKLRSFEGLKVEIYSYGVLPAFLLPLAAITVLVVEFLLFLFFATGWADGWKHLMGIGMLAAFTWLTWRKKKNTGVGTCACFGNIGFLNRFPIYRNFALMIFLLIDASFNRERGDVYSMIYSLVFVMALSFSIEVVQLLRKRNEA
ncbi:MULTISPECIES: MauE/DoxX family redox-associated membrane protein [Paenibacillus]|uniref:MauE/DoxX family redox-associated membrane protein n=1 Tax=Paenibacillus TaxID=44249 RepID=UPI001FC980D9|nr:MauE/DoxX family redox-associated membrane protein [Paenibacillus rhizosphaerae]